MFERIERTVPRVEVEYSDCPEKESCALVFVNEAFRQHLFCFSF